MTTLSQPQKIVTFLKDNLKQKFTARHIAKEITQIYADDYQEKRHNPRFENDKAFVQQIAAEIGAHKDNLLSLNYS